MNRIILLAVSFTALSSAAFGADYNLVRDYVKKSGFRNDIEAGLKLIKVPESKAGIFKRFVDGINFNAIEDSYVQDLAQRLTNEEANALIKSLEIKGLHGALGKQGLASAAVSVLIAKEIEKSGKAVGLLPQDNTAPPTKRTKK